MKSFADLEAWQCAMDLLEEVYDITKKFPKEEVFGVTSQLRRASFSIIANIAEGFGRYTYNDKAHKYTIARGECTEVEAFLLGVIRLEFISVQEAQTSIELAKRTGRLLSGLISSCRKRS